MFERMIQRKMEEQPVPLKFLVGMVALQVEILGLVKQKNWRLTLLSHSFYQS